MCMLTRRFQILLDEEQFKRLSKEASSRNVPVAALIREAIDRTYPAVSSRRAAAVRRILAAPGMPVPDPPELRAELDELRGRRG
jgi:hypothetical protein